MQPSIPDYPLVRRLTTADAEVWAALRAEALQRHPLAFGSSAPDNPRELIEQFNSRLASEAVVFGAFHDSTLVGVCGIARNINLKERHKATIWGMYVTEQCRRSGAGKMLLNAAIDQATNWGTVELVHLSVSEAANEARLLYEKAGFKVWGREPQALNWNGRYVDESHMVLRLSSRKT